MKLLATLCATFIWAAGSAQIWCPPGAEWTNGYHAIDWTTGDTYQGTLVSRYIGDTVIAGHAAQRIGQHLYYELAGTGEPFDQPWRTVHTRHTDDMVLIWDPWAQQFDTLLWPGAVPGDRWTVPVHDDPDLFYVVTDTATVWVDGVPLRRTAVAIMYTPYYPEPFSYDTLYERIGTSVWACFDPPHPGADGIDLWFRCYRDDGLSYSAPGTVDCQFTLAVEGHAPAAEVNVYPSPGTDRFWIERPTPLQGPVNVRVTDMTGAVVGTWRMNTGPLQVDASTWAAGSYFIELAGEQRQFRATWLKR